MTSLDTNVILRLLLNDNLIQKQQAVQVIERNQAYITDTVFTEVVFVLEKLIGLPRTSIHGLLIRVLGLPSMVYSWFLPEVLELYAQRPALSIIDCYAATETRAFKNQLVTFDKKLASQGGTHVKLL